MKFFKQKTPHIFQAFRTESEACLEDELKEAAEQAAAMRITEKKKERKSSESKDTKKEVCNITQIRCQ